jgi:arsenate reductase
MLTIYGISSCDSCRKARKYLADHDIEFRFHDLRADGLDLQMLERWASSVGWNKLLNRKSLTWRKIPEVDRDNMTEDNALVSMIEMPTLVKRPVLESGKFVTVGFAPEQIDEFLKLSGLRA